MEWISEDYLQYQKKYQEWLLQCAQIIYEHEEISRKRKIAAVVALFVNEKRSKKSYKKKRFWVAPILKEREEHGFYHALFPILQLEDLRFHNYLRMSATQLEKLINLVGHNLQKKIVLRNPIGVTERLVITLRYLASGDSITSISYQFLVGLTTVSNIIKETCTAIWNNLQPLVLPSTLQTGEWIKIANYYEKRWDFPLCVGAIDGKHVTLQCPNNAGSEYFNQKGTHSIVLIAICDGKYIFRFVDIGAYGRRSDGGIFKESNVGCRFENNQMNLPSPKPIYENGPLLPFCLVGDEAFPLKNYLLRPYPGKGNIDLPKRIFNYRLGRARRTIENTFGILVSRWRIYRKPIIMKVSNCIKVVKATICLHNWLKEYDFNDSVKCKYFTEDLIDQDGVDGSFRPGT